MRPHSIVVGCKLGEDSAQTRLPEHDHVVENAPWFVVPADNKWFTRLVVAAAIVDAMENLNLAYAGLTSGTSASAGEQRISMGRYTHLVPHCPLMTHFAVAE